MVLGHPDTLNSHVRFETLCVCCLSRPMSPTILGVTANRSSPLRPAERCNVLSLPYYLLSELRITKAQDQGGVAK
jgi:hypothetical protein